MRASKALLAAKTDRELLEEIHARVTEVADEVRELRRFRLRAEKEIQRARSRLRVWAVGRGLL